MNDISNSSGHSIDLGDGTAAAAAAHRSASATAQTLILSGWRRFLFVALLSSVHFCVKICASGVAVLFARSRAYCARPIRALLTRTKPRVLLF